MMAGKEEKKSNIPKKKKKSHKKIFPFASFSFLCLILIFLIFYLLFKMEMNNKKKKVSDVVVGDIQIINIYTQWNIELIHESTQNFSCVF
jgi:quinol-cytochrome oxidoreductase complex cytochrome b subunit